MTSNPENATSAATADPAAEASSRRRRPPLFTPEQAPTPDSPPPSDQLGSPPPGSDATPPGPETGSSAEPDKPKRRRRRRDEPSASPGSDTPAPAPKVNPASKNQLKKAVKAAVRVAGGQLHMLAARDELERDYGVWLTDEDDQEGIGEPVSSLLARRGGPGMVNPDVADVLALVVALFGYIGKQLDIRAHVRALREGGVTGATEPASAPPAGPLPSPAPAAAAASGEGPAAA